MMWGEDYSWDIKIITREVGREIQCVLFATE